MKKAFLLMIAIQLGLVSIEASDVKIELKNHDLASLNFLFPFMQIFIILY